MSNPFLGGISRRRFTQGAAGLAGLAAMPGLVWANEPKQGGKLRAAIAEGSTTDSLDPQTYTDTFMLALGLATHSTLTEISPEGQLVGDAADSWEASDGGGVWTFRLRDGVTFSDGARLTAADVIASIEHHRGEDSKSAAKDIVTPIKAMRADGDNVVVFELDAPNADFPYLMADYHLLLMPRDADGKANWQDFIGSAGYTMEFFEPGVRAVLKRRDDYWKAGRAHIDEIEMLVVADAAARQSALIAGEVDMMSRCDLKTVHLLSRRPGIRVEESTGFLHYTAPMLTNVAPYDNNDLRLALKYAIDREQLVSRILRGHGTVGNDHPIAPSVPFFNTALEQRTFDLDKAKYHLEKSGYGGEELVFHSSDAAYAGAVDASVLMKETMAQAGLNVRVQREPADGYWSNVWMKKPWSACYWGGRPTCDWMFTQAYAAGANWNDTFWEHERFNELLVQGRSELNDTVRGEIYGEMQQIVSDEGGVIIWAFANYVDAVQDHVQHGPHVASNWSLDGGRFAERWWVN